MSKISPIRKSDALSRWNVRDAEEVYGVRRWGKDYFRINPEGNVQVAPTDANGTIDMKKLVDDLTRRGIELPILLRFGDILKARIIELNEAFAKAIADSQYQGVYRAVFPIKVNQNRKVVEEIIQFGKSYHYGLEAGSKPELLCVMALHEDRESLILCNGYKDREYVETALLASTLGKKVILTVEKLSELGLILDVAEELGIDPQIGFRAKLSTRGAGRWQLSGGDRSKFGLTAAEIMQAVALLKERQKTKALKLLHFHLGSQISAIRSIKNALREAGFFYAELHHLGCSELTYFDVGGGLGVDYDGSQTNFASSMNYSVQEYANDVVHSVQEICVEKSVPFPTIVSESGRAVVAHHSVLVIDVLGVTEFEESPIPAKLPDDSPQLVRNFLDTYKNINAKNLTESYHDAVEYKDQVLQLFSLGHLSLQDRVTCESLFWNIARRVRAMAEKLSHLPEELEALDKLLIDTYFCNFSMFQSMPDAWAVDQLFPIMPIHRLNERPDRKGIIADITCDSDGKIDKFIDLRDVKNGLELHPMNGAPYYLGVFLVGAYQEILGDMHNLFGDTNTVHVSIASDGHYFVDEVVQGDSIDEVLRYVEYSPKELKRRVRKQIEEAVRDGRIDLDQSRMLMKRFRSGLTGYTYLS